MANAVTVAGRRKGVGVEVAVGAGGRSVKVACGVLVDGRVDVALGAAVGISIGWGGVEQAAVRTTEARNRM